MKMDYYFAHCKSTFCSKESTHPSKFYSRKDDLVDIKSLGGKLSISIHELSKLTPYNNTKELRLVNMLRVIRLECIFTKK